MASIDLSFPLSQIKPIAEHAMTATDHYRTYSQQETGEPGVPALLWVKDDGTYLHSSGRPRQLADPDNDPHRARVSYALGWDANTGPELGVTDVGGDDFVEPIPLNQNLTTGGSLIATIRGLPEQAWLILTVEPGTYALWFDITPSTHRTA